MNSCASILINCPLFYFHCPHYYFNLSKKDFKFGNLTINKNH